MGNKVTLAGIEAKIKSVEYIVLSDGRTTLAHITLENGFTVRGESSCVDPANFDQAEGQKYARENAVEKVWALEGYLLKEHMWRSGPLESFQDRVRREKAELDEKLEKLRAFLRNAGSPVLTTEEDDLLYRQGRSMSEYSQILQERIAGFE